MRIKKTHTSPQAKNLLSSLSARCQRVDELLQGGVSAEKLADLEKARDEWAGRLAELKNARAKADALSASERTILQYALDKAEETAIWQISLADEAMQKIHLKEIHARAEKAFQEMAAAHDVPLEKLLVTFGHEIEPKSAAEHLKTIACEFCSDWRYFKDLDAVYGNGFKYASFFEEE